MARGNKEVTFSDLTFEVQKLTTAQFEHGKDSEQYKKQHTKSVSVVKELNGLYGHGYASLSKARHVLAERYRFEKAKEAEELLKAQQNSKR